VFPKRLTLGQLEEQIELTYEQYWQVSRVGTPGSFVKVFYELVCPPNDNKSKNDQNLLNTLESINRLQHKESGVRIFLMFLSETYSKEQLSYFLVLRALLEEFAR
jgi:hypothetical protein